MSKNIKTAIAIYNRFKTMYDRKSFLLLKKSRKERERITDSDSKKPLNDFRPFLIIFAIWVASTTISAAW